MDLEETFLKVLDFVSAHSQPFPGRRGRRRKRGEEEDDDDSGFVHLESQPKGGG